jgi:hypothetical protein
MPPPPLAWGRKMIRSLPLDLSGEDRSRSARSGEGPRIPVRPPCPHPACCARRPLPQGARVSFFVPATPPRPSHAITAESESGEADPDPGSSNNFAGRSHQRPPGWIALPFTDPLLYPPPLAGEEGGGAPTTNKEKREAERRQTRSQRPHPAGRGARPAGRARLSAFHRGACGGDRTPPLNSSHALPATVLGRCGRYPLPAVMQCSELLADRSSCRSGVFTQSRPGVAVTSRHPREPHSLHRSASPATSLTRARCRHLS